MSPKNPTLATQNQRFSRFKMRKKDIRPHNPALKPSSLRNFIHQYVPLLRLFLLWVATLVSLASNTYTLFALKMVALESNVTVETVTIAFCVYFFELSVLFFCLVHLFRPNWLPLHKHLQPPRRYHRTHISHLRLDRASKYGLSQKAVTSSDSFANARSSDPYRPDTISRPSVNGDPSGNTAASGTCLDPTVDGDGDCSASDSDSMPGLVEASDDEGDDDDEDTDDWSSTDSIFEPWPSSEQADSGFSDDDIPLPSHPRHCRCDPPHHRRTFLAAPEFHCSGGGFGEPQPAASPINVTSDDDLDDSIPYNPADWIGVGRTWSVSFPPCVKRARNAARGVPVDARSMVFPEETASVTDLLFEVMPALSTDTQPASFSSEAPNVEGSSIHWPHTLFTAIPFLPFLRASFNDAWLAGAKSISFPHLPDKLYPLWTENFLSEIKSFLGKRARWQSAKDWLSGLHIEEDDVPHLFLLDSCWRRLGRLPWDGVVPGLSAAVRLTTQDLALFLGHNWLNDEMINAGVDYILRRLEPWSRIRILNCLFIQSLTNARAAGRSYRPPKFSSIEKAIMAGKVDTVFFPLHVSGNHWTLLKIDLVSKTIAYADSLGRSPPTEELALVRWWLQSLLPDSPSFHLVEPDFDYPRQQDGHSCGIIVLSILATILLDYDIWKPEHAAFHRLQWFLNLSETFSDPVELYKFEFDTDSEFEIPSTGPATPESSDFEVIPVPLSGSSAASRPTSPFESSLSSPMLCDSDALVPPPAAARFELDDVDFFLDLPASSDPVVLDQPFDSVAISDQPDSVAHPENYPEPTSTTADDSFVSLPPPAPNYYASSDGEDSDSDSDGSQPRRHRSGHRRNNGPKAGSSWARQKQLNAAAKDPDFKASTTRLGTFRNKVREDDPLAEFDDTDVRRVRCSRCTTWVHMRALYDLVRWREHRGTTKCKRNTGSATQSLFSLGFKKLSPAEISSAKTSPTIPRRTITLPCPGLTRESDDEIATYISRTSVSGGGAPSRGRLSMDLFSSKWSDLTVQQQRMVLRREATLQQWKIGRAVGAVFSASCLRDVQTFDGDEPQPCDECQGLYRLHLFRVAIHRPMPDEGSMKFVPVAYRDKELGTLYLRYHGVRDLIELDDGRSPWLKFAQGCADGTYSSDTLTGMVKAMVLKSTRIKKGQSMKNLRYPSEFDQFCNLLASTSPRAYLTFQKTFGGPGLRAMRAKRAKLPRFQPDISAFNVATAAETLKKLKYEGPVALSWDDTALETCISIYQESKEVCLIIGGADGAIRVTENDDLDALFEAAKLQKADKLRVWLLTIPLPKIPPILVAAVARGSSTKAEDLVEMHSKLADLLHQYNIHPISLSSDGAEVERAAQRMITESAPNYHIYVIPNATPGCQITLKIPLYYGYHPTIILQDSKHALKTARNQIITGARILSLGFFTALYAHIRDLALNIRGPLYTRDVEKVDKQDDRAASRLFSGNTLEFQLQNYPGQNGLSIYLFIIGELIDAWQNRNISHRDRAKMVLRARFFLMAWRSHIDSHPDHSVHTHFISRESYDILLTICDGLLSLLVAYRKYFPTYPLLPWLHSTEPCEHLFGMLRDLKKDFNYADVLYLERKLRVLMMGAFGNLSPDQQVNQTAGGYHHTYFNADDLDTFVLLQYPTDEELGKASKYALDEASQLLKVLGIEAQPMLRDYTAPEPPARQSGPSYPISRPPQTVIEFSALYDSPATPFKSFKDEETFEACEMALAAEDLDKTLAIAALPDSTEESLKSLRSDIEEQLELLTKQIPWSGPLPPSPADYALPLTLGNTLNDLILITERMRHQPKSTAKAVRQHGRLSVTMMKHKAAMDKDSGPSLRESLLRRLAAIIPASDPHNKTTGVDRYVRHTGTFGGSGAPANTRVQNKATVKSVAASKFVAARAKAFANVQWIHENMHFANIMELNPLKPDDFVIVLKGGVLPEVVLGTVITMYTKNTMHDWIPTATSVGTPSYIYVSAYRHFAGAIFSSMACEKLSCPTVLQIPRTHILFSLSSFTKIIRQDVTTADCYPHTMATLCPSSLMLFEKLRQSRTALQTAVRELGQLMKEKPEFQVSPIVFSGAAELADEEFEDQEDGELAVNISS